MDDGVIKYRQDFVEGPAPDAEAIADLVFWRNEMFRFGLIGEYPEIKIGYGNISQKRSGERKFWISGTQTGHIAECGPEQFTQVTDYSIAGNWLKAQGPMKASSEALTHAAIYEADAEILGIVHIHQKASWESIMQAGLPTTRANVPYGTPEMATEIGRLFEEADLGKHRLLAMAGHEDGVIAFGKTVEAAAKHLLSELKKMDCLPEWK